MYRWWESIRNEEREAMMLSEEDRQTYMPDLMSELVASASTGSWPYSTTAPKAQS